MKKDLEKIILLMQRECINTDLKNLASMSVGSDYKSKDEIITQTTSLALSAINFQSLCLSALEWIAGGKTLTDFLEYQSNEVTRKDQPKSDGDSRRAILDRFVVETLEIH